MGNRANRLRVLQVGCKDHLLAHGFRDIDADDAAMGDRAAQKCDVVKVRKSEVAGELAAHDQMTLVFITLQRSADTLIPAPGYWRRITSRLLRSNVHSTPPPTPLYSSQQHQIHN